jgi:hypothetical protein
MRLRELCRRQGCVVWAGVRGRGRGSEALLRAPSLESAEQRKHGGVCLGAAGKRHHVHGDIGAAGADGGEGEVSAMLAGAWCVDGDQSGAQPSQQLCVRMAERGRLVALTLRPPCACVVPSS